MNRSELRHWFGRDKTKNHVLWRVSHRESRMWRSRSSFPVFFLSFSLSLSLPLTRGYEFRYTRARALVRSFLLSYSLSTLLSTNRYLAVCSTTKFFFNPFLFYSTFLAREIRKPTEQLHFIYIYIYTRTYRFVSIINTHALIYVNMYVFLYSYI